MSVLFDDEWLSEYQALVDEVLFALKQKENLEIRQKRWDEDRRILMKTSRLVLSPMALGKLEKYVGEKEKNLGLSFQSSLGGGLRTK